MTLYKLYHECPSDEYLTYISEYVLLPPTISKRWNNIIVKNYMCNIRNILKKYKSVNGVLKDGNKIEISYIINYYNYCPCITDIYEFIDIAIMKGYSKILYWGIDLSKSYYIDVSYNELAFLAMAYEQEEILLSMYKYITDKNLINNISLIAIKNNNSNLFYSTINRGAYHYNDMAIYAAKYNRGNILFDILKINKNNINNIIIELLNHNNYSLLYFIYEKYHHIIKNDNILDNITSIAIRDNRIDIIINILNNISNQTILRDKLLSLNIHLLFYLIPHINDLNILNKITIIAIDNNRWDLLNTLIDKGINIYDDIAIKAISSYQDHIVYYMMEMGIKNKTKLLEYAIKYNNKSIIDYLSN